MRSLFVLVALVALMGRSGAGEGATQQRGKLTRKMEKVLGRGQTPAIGVVPTNGKLTTLTQPPTRDERADQSRDPSERMVHELRGGDGKVELLLPVSGHQGIRAAAHYARNTRFNVDGGGVGGFKVVKARGLVTPLKLDLTPGRNIIIASPAESSPQFMPHARQVEIHYKP